MPLIHATTAPCDQTSEERDGLLEEATWGLNDEIAELVLSIIMETKSR